MNRQNSAFLDINEGRAGQACVWAGRNADQWNRRHGGQFWPNKHFHRKKNREQVIDRVEKTNLHIKIMNDSCGRMKENQSELNWLFWLGCEKWSPKWPRPIRHQVSRHKNWFHNQAKRDFIELWPINWSKWVHENHPMVLSYGFGPINRQNTVIPADYLLSCWSNLMHTHAHKVSDFLSINQEEKCGWLILFQTHTRIESRPLHIGST